MSLPTSDTPATEGLPGPWEAAPLDPRISEALSGLPDDFAGFDRIYSEQIQPTLRGHEDARKKAVQYSVWAGIGGVAASLLGGVISMTGFDNPLGFFIGGGLGLFGFAVANAPLGEIKKKAKHLLVGPVAKHFDVIFTEKPGKVLALQDYRALNLIPSWDRVSCEDQIEGIRKNVAFHFFEAHLEERRTTTDSKGRTRTYWVTVFRGQLVRFGFPKRFLGITMVLRDAGLFNFMQSAGSDLKRARLESPDFEKAFEVYTNDQVEARFLLTPDVMQRLVDLETTFRGGNLRCVFHDGDIHLAVEGGDMFEPGSMLTPLDNPDRVRELLDDFASLFNLIDTLTNQMDRGSGQRPDLTP
jgi:hypothetical protein